MDIDAVAHFNCDFAKIFMGTVHGVPQLEGRYFTPTLFFENFAGLGRAHVDTGVFGRVFTLTQHFDGTGQIDIFLAHDHLNTRMIVFGDFPELFSRRSAFAHEDFFAFIFFIFGGHFKFIGNLHGRHGFAVCCNQSDLFAVSDLISVCLVSGKSNRYGPESSVRCQEIITYALPVSFGHKPCQWAESPDTHHDDVTLFAGGDCDFF